MVHGWNHTHWKCAESAIICPRIEEINTINTNRSTFLSHTTWKLYYKTVFCMSCFLFDGTIVLLDFVTHVHTLRHTHTHLPMMSPLVGKWGPRQVRTCKTLKCSPPSFFLSSFQPVLLLLTPFYSSLTATCSFHLSLHPIPLHTHTHLHTLFITYGNIYILFCSFLQLSLFPLTPELLFGFLFVFLKEWSRNGMIISLPSRTF